MLEELGVPVLVDPVRATSPIRLEEPSGSSFNGVLTGKEAEANAFFEKQQETVAAFDDYE